MDLEQTSFDFQTNIADVPAPLVPQCSPSSDEVFAHLPIDFHNLGGNQCIFERFQFDQ